MPTAMAVSIARHASLGDFPNVGRFRPNGERSTVAVHRKRNEFRAAVWYRERFAAHERCVSRLRDSMDRQTPSIRTDTAPKRLGITHWKYPPAEKSSLRLRLARRWRNQRQCSLARNLTALRSSRMQEADEFYAERMPNHEQLTAEERRVARQAYAGLLCSKQFYH